MQGVPFKIHKLLGFEIVVIGWPILNTLCSFQPVYFRRSIATRSLFLKISTNYLDAKAKKDSAINELVFREMFFKINLSRKLRKLILNIEVKSKNKIKAVGKPIIPSQPM